MALNAGVHWGTILRPYVDQGISQDGWKYLLSCAVTHFNFDGEIFGLGFDMADQLRSFGYKGSEAGQDADFIDVDAGFRTAIMRVNWLELVEVTPFAETTRKFHAWKLSNSGVYTVMDNNDLVQTKGYSVDWPPYIGKIE